MADNFGVFLWRPRNLPQKAVVAIVTFSALLAVVGQMFDLLGWVIWAGLFGAMSVIFFTCTLFCTIFFWVTGRVSL